MPAPSRLGRWGSLLVCILGLSGVCRAQTPGSGRSAGTDESSRTPRSTAPSETSSDRPDRPVPPIRLFGDPSRFTRMGGWGGMAGTIGQFGMTKAMLVMMPGVQKELGIDDEQREKLEAWSRTFRERGETMARSAGLSPGGPPPGVDPAAAARGGTGPNPVEIGAQIYRMMNFMTTMNSFFREAEEAAAKILTKAQRKRLEQIALQMEGLSALAREDVARALNLDSGKSEMIRRILEEARTGQMTYWVGEMTKMALSRRDRGARGETTRPGQSETRTGGSEVGAEAEAKTAPRPKTDAADAAPKEAPAADSSKTPPDDPEEAKKKAERDARREQMRKRFEAMQQGSDAIQNAAVTRILRLLTTKQKTAFDRMLGEPFDPNALIPARDEREAAERRSESAKASKPATPMPEGARERRPPSLRERRFGAGANPAP
ncbi:MAG: hypothetical protein SFX72_14410 [Isosphaeraceae bacterium]|nr:hypothetical protein [Isosphaeraceae bacterium]